MKQYSETLRALKLTMAGLDPANQRRASARQ
jgi:hypothetical protein